ncbi:oligosaccharyl transferase, archaeosortase A system-associated [Halobacteriales archaeon QS_4_70_19]|nr:MAG: oligosaccharyl transferase, archaeosortase A system-associated [Halobacteriales archaeon QS_4_70_19]
MSQPSKSISEQVEDLDLSTDVLRDYYHVPVVAALFAFMLWIRARNWGEYVTGDQVLFSGNDAYYHYRMVQYTVNNFPSTMPFDPWTSFPTGTSVGQFGTLFDQLIATAALVYGLGSPTAYQVKLVTLFAPAVFGALAVIPTYYLGKRLGGRGGGIIAALIIALTPGQFLTRSLAGFSDHHVAETFFMALSVVFIAIALEVVIRDRPIWELFTARDWDALRPTLVWSALAGAAMGLYIWVWPPGVLLTGIVATFLVLYLLGTYIRGYSPDHVGIAGTVMMTVAFLMALVPINTFSFSATDFSIAQPFVGLAGALACVVIVGGSRLWEGLDQDLPRAAFPAALVGGGLVVLGVVAVALPDVFGFFQRQLLRIVGFGATRTARTVAEATPVQNPGRFLYNSYGLAFYTAVIGLAYLTYRSLREDYIAPVGVFVVIWSLFMLAAAFTQRRFDYYLILSVCALNAFLAKEVFDLLNVDEIADDITSIEGYQVLSILTVVLVITAPLAIRPSGGSYSNVVDTSERQASPGSVQNWESGLRWLDQQTPEEGEWGENPESGLSKGPYGTYERTGDFNYKSGDYGVLAWWDYGHWITVLGDRVPDANPFQQNAEYAAEMFLTTNETYARGSMIDTAGDSEQTRYVMLDYQMGLAGTRKFSAPAAWQRRYAVNKSTGEFVVNEFGGNDDGLPDGLRPLAARDLSRSLYVAQQTQNGPRLVSRYGIHTQRSMESFRTRLYQYHGSRAEPTFRDGSVLVADWEAIDYRGRQFAGITGATQPIRTFPNETAAEQYVRRDGTAQIGGVLGKPSEPVPALQHYRLVWASERTVQTPISRAFALWSQLNGQQPQAIESTSYLKTFERVEGATVQGQGPANTNVTATVRMRIPTNGRTFTYQQQARTDEGGSFTMTLPYSTEGYDQFGPEEGRTNVSVRAAGPYTFTTSPQANQSAIVSYQATANVSEAQVIGVDEEPVTVELQERVVNQPNNGSDDSGTDGNSGTDDGSTDGRTPTPTPDGTATPTPSQSLAPPAWLAAPLATLR